MAVRGVLGPPALLSVDELEDEEDAAAASVPLVIAVEGLSLDVSVTVSDGPKETVRLGVLAGRSSVIFAAAPKPFRKRCKMKGKCECDDGDGEQVQNLGTMEPENSHSVRK